MLRWIRIQLTRELQFGKSSCQLILGETNETFVLFCKERQWHIDEELFSCLPFSLLDKTWSYSSRSISSRSFNNRAQIIFTCFNVRRCCCVGDERRDSCWPDGFEVVIESLVFDGDEFVSSSERSVEVAFNWWRRWSRRTSSLIRFNRASEILSMVKASEKSYRSLTGAWNRL